VLVVCETCEQEGQVRCCEDCRQIGMPVEADGKPKGKRMCRCESDRERSLWGDEGAKLSRSKRQQKTKAAGQ
jgi:hypothetical protein